MTIPIYENVLYGDTSGTLGDHAVAGAQQWSLANPYQLQQISIVGDAQTLRQAARGGDDRVFAIWNGAISVVGDAVNVIDHAHGGDDTIEGGGSGFPPARRAAASSLRP